MAQPAPMDVSTPRAPRTSLAFTFEEFFGAPQPQPVPMDIGSVRSWTWGEFFGPVEIAYGQQQFAEQLTRATDCRDVRLLEELWQQHLTNPSRYPWPEFSKTITIVVARDIPFMRFAIEKNWIKKPLALWTSSRLVSLVRHYLDSDDPAVVRQAVRDSDLVCEFFRRGLMAGLDNTLQGWPSGRAIAGLAHSMHFNLTCEWLYVVRKIGPLTLKRLETQSWVLQECKEARVRFLVTMWGALYRKLPRDLAAEVAEYLYV